MPETSQASAPAVTEIDALSASIDARLADQRAAWTARAEQRRELRRELAVARKIGKSRHHARRLAAATDPGTGAPE